MSLSANIFRKRGPTPSERLHEAKLKKVLSSELSTAIKALQQEHCTTGEAIHSTDTANHVCNVIEAIFLHGLKNSVARKLGKYVGLQNGENADNNINFWAFATKFTHKDTTAQLTRLGQITTEIGLCRAWIRMALNDGLIGSYIDAMLQDKKTLQYFYDKLAYLLDFEHQEILKSLLKGLMILEFKLSYNSRVLNSWTNTPLVLAGLLEHDNTPTPVVQSSAKHKNSQDLNAREVNQKTAEDTVKIHHVSHKISGSLKEPKTPPNTPSLNVGNFSEGFTRQDVENLKKYKSGSSPPDTECSSSSHISCPDPIKYNKNPTVYLENDSKDDAMFTLTEEEDSPQKSFVSNDIESVIKRASEQDKKRSSPLHEEAWHSVNGISQETLTDTNGNTEEKWNGVNEVTNKASPSSYSNEFDIPAKFSIESKESPVSNSQTESILDNAIDKDNEHSLDHSREDHHARILADILNDNSFNHDTQFSPDQADSGIVNSPSSNTSSQASSPVITGVKIRGKKHNLKPDFSASKHESAPEVSPAVANSIETSKLKYGRHRYSLPNIKIFRNSPQGPSNDFETISESQAPMRPRSESDKAEDKATEERPASVGNSLGAASGWSSSFHLEDQDTVQPLPEFSVYDTSSQTRPKSESFGSLLQNYTPGSSVTSPTIDDVVHDLPGSANLSSPVQHRIYEVEEDTVLIEGYEIAPSFSDTINESKLALLGEIANEKGLDAQNYQCKGCTRPVGLIYGKPRVCTFDAWYYCFECHENDEYYIPAMILHNWDFRKHPVAKCNFRFLEDIEDQAKLDISKINPKLYEHVKEMADLKVARTQLYYLKTYLFTCKQSIADEFRQSLWPREYFYENIHMYSLGDFLQVPSGTLLQSLRKVIKFATKHVYECRLCSQKGYICELCNQPRVIYPFEIETTVRCHQCKSVFHKTCKVDGKACPKCLRRQQRKSQMGVEAETPDSGDYAFIPEWGK